MSSAHLMSPWNIKSEHFQIQDHDRLFSPLSLSEVLKDLFLRVIKHELFSQGPLPLPLLIKGNLNRTFIHPKINNTKNSESKLGNRVINWESWGIIMRFCENGVLGRIVLYHRHHTGGIKDELFKEAECSRKPTSSWTHTVWREPFIPVCLSPDQALEGTATSNMTPVIGGQHCPLMLMLPFSWYVKFLLVLELSFKTGG